MDRRSLLFIVAVGLSMIGFNYWFSPAEEAKAPPVPKKIALAAPAPADDEQFYVFENAYQQLVFSNKGGALAEINLPIHSAQHPDSSIRKIEADRESDTYYPLLRKGVVGKDPRHYAFTILSEGPVLNYQVKNQTKTSITFESVEPSRTITKTFSFPEHQEKSPYCIELAVQIEGEARGLRLTSGIPEVELVSGSPAPALKYRTLRNQKAVVEALDLPKTENSLSTAEPLWVCNSNGFLGLIIQPLTEIGTGFNTVNVPGTLAPSRLALVNKDAESYAGYEMQLPLIATQEPMRFNIFAGPFDTQVLKVVDSTNSAGYSASQSSQGWFSFISEPFAKFLFVLMNFFFNITHSWGISIILLTAALRVMLYPLNAWSIKSTIKMQQISPQVAAIQEKHKKEPKKAQQEIMNLYREKGVNPLTGCLPILIQMPFLIGMFDLLKTTFELRGASFIPGWIDNLAAPDVLFSWGTPIFFFGSDFHLLPIILGAVMYLQQKLSSPLPKDVNQLTDTQRQQKFMGNIMAIVFTVMFYNFPSGLNIYWLSSMLLGILQQWLTTKSMNKKAAT